MTLEKNPVVFSNSVQEIFFGVKNECDYEHSHTLTRHTNTLTSIHKGKHERCQQWNRWDSFNNIGSFSRTVCLTIYVIEALFLL